MAAPRTQVLVESKNIQNFRSAMDRFITNENNKSKNQTQNVCKRQYNVSWWKKLSNQDLLVRAKKEFYKNRELVISGIPPCTYNEVKEFMGGFEICDISISKKSRKAVVTIQKGEEATDIAYAVKGKRLLDAEVTVSVNPHVNLMCLTQLPFNFHDEDLDALVEPYGRTERLFLLRNEKTGESKGYGFVEFSHNKEKTLQVREQLDEKKFGSCIMHCDFVPVTVMEYKDLHSKCLMVDHLPNNYSNETEFKNVFSRVSSPTHCQLVQLNGKPVGVGIVEFKTPLEAENTQLAVNKYKLGDHSIRVTFCMPGLSAVGMYNRVVKSMADRTIRPSGLLPSPPNIYPSVTSNPMVQNLIAQNPQLLANFQQLLQTLHDSNCNPLTENMKENHPNGLQDPSFQLALIVMLASQVAAQGQTVKGAPSKPSLLGFPWMGKAGMCLNNLNNQSQQRMTTRSQQSAQPTSLGKLPKPQQPTQTASQCRVTRSQRLKETQSTSQVYASSQQPQGTKSQKLVTQAQQSKDMAVQHQEPRYVKKQEQCQMKKTQIPEVMQDTVDKLIMQNTIKPEFLSQKVLHGNENNMDTYMQQHPKQEIDNGLCNYEGKNKTKRKHDEVEFQIPNHHHYHLRPRAASYSGPPKFQKSSCEIQQRAVSQEQLETKDETYIPPMTSKMYSSVENMDDAHLQGLLDMSSAPVSTTLSAAPVSTTPSAPVTESTHIGELGLSSVAEILQNLRTPVITIRQPSQSGGEVINVPTETGVYQIDTGFVEHLLSEPTTRKKGRRTRISDTAKSTPANSRKRGSAHLLPSPEPSPEGNYVGQHSQGIGGHYAESFFKRKRLM